MRSKILSTLLLAGSIFMAPVAQSAGMIVIDPVPGMPAMPVVSRMQPVPVHGRRPPVVLKGSVSYGLRLQAADVRVDIKDQVAKTYITQTFVNDTDRNLAGTYLFPLPEDTTFSSFSLHIDGKPVEGKILEANEARQQYEEIVRRMVDPGLLEYADYKTVRARIFPIPAHGTKKVELEYTQLLRADQGLMKYRFPLKTEGSGGSVAADEIKVNVKLSSKQGLRTIWSPTHAVDVNRTDDHLAKVAYLGKDMLPDKDFMLYYSISDKDLSANVLSHKDTNEDGYYLLTLTPPVSSKQTNAKDIVLVADTSGSMTGERMTQNKKALKYLVNALSTNDRFNIIEFNTDVESFKSSLVQATPENKKSAMSFIEDLEAHGGTNIGDALKHGCTMLESNANNARPGYLVLMTDGEPTVGLTSVDGLLKSIHPKRDIRIFDFGVGYDVNTKLLNKLADAHHGTAQYIEPEESLETALSSFYNKIKSPVLTNVKLTYEGIEAKNTYPREVKDIFAGSQVLMIGRYKNGGSGTVKLTGSLNGAQKTYSFPVSLAKEESGNTYLPRIWAMRRIGYLTDVAHENGNNREVVNEIVALSKKYGIISQFTSFLVTDPNEGAPNLAMQNSVTRLAGAPRSRRQSAQWYRAPREVQILDERPVIHDFRAVPPPPASGGFGAPAPKASVSSALAPSGMPDSNEAADGDFLMSWGSSKSESATGKRAVMKAKMMNSLKDSEGISSQRAAPGMKTVEDKTFYLRSGVWTDSAYDGHQHTENVEFGSKAYFDLMHNVPGISKFLAVGKDVIVVFKGHVYRITSK